MPPPSLSPVTARELVHLLILQRVVGLRDGGGVTVKGSVNLRLFFGSARYSEDMDLDCIGEASAAVRSCLKSVFEDRQFTEHLQRQGVLGLDPGEGANKDTETTFRYKFGGSSVEVCDIRPRWKSHFGRTTAPEAPGTKSGFVLLP